MRAKPIALALCLGLSASGCIDTLTESTSIELAVQGTRVDGAFEGRDGVPISLERAHIVFGPVYLCAGFTAGNLCDESLAEWRGAVVVDALSAEPTAVASMDALTGTARSYMYDFGIASRLTTPEMPLVTPAAESLGPASAVVSGRAEVEGQSIPFTVSVRVEQTGAVEQGVPVVRSGESDGIEQEILPDGQTRLRVRFDPRPWLATANFRALVEDAACEAGRDVVCAGAVEQTCAPDGALVASRECDANGQVCVRERGCVDRLELGAESQLGRALRSGVEAGARPEFVFEVSP
ncbi:MAG: hypothetical protein AB8I08_38435 [Sandaracinaceae bacterium]